MKKLIITLFALLAFTIVNAQRISSLPEVTTAPDASLLYIRQGSTGNVISKITKANLFSTINNIETDSIVVDGGMVYMYEGGDTLNVYIPTADQGNLYDYAVRKHLTDTLVLTAQETYRLKVADDGRIIRYNGTHGLSLFVPPDSTSAIPIGAVINVKMDLTGQVQFKAGTGVILQSKNDSIGIKTRNGWATLIKRTSLKWDLFGDLQD